MKDFYSTQNASPQPHALSKSELMPKLETFDSGKGLRDKVMNQSNLLKMQFYNHIAFPKKDEIAQQIRNRSNRILSFSMVAEDSGNIQQKAEVQQPEEREFESQDMFVPNQTQIQNYRSTLLLNDNRSLTENPRIKVRYKSRKSSNHSQLNYADQNDQLENQLLQNQCSTLDLFPNMESEIQLMKKSSVDHAEYLEDKPVSKLPSVLLPKFDQLQPFEYKNMSALSSNLIHKRKDKVTMRNDIQKVGNMYVYHNHHSNNNSSDLCSQKLPQLKDSYTDVLQNCMNRNANNFNKLSPSPKKNSYDNIYSSHPLNEQEQQLSSQYSIRNMKIENFEAEQSQNQNNNRKSSSPERKQTIIKVIRSKRKNRQNSLPSANILVSHCINAQSISLQNEAAIVKSMTKSNDQTSNNVQSLNPQRQSQDLQQKQEYYHKHYRNNSVSNHSSINDKSSLSRILMKQQPLKLQEIKIHNQLTFEQIPPTPPTKQMYNSPNIQKKRVHSQQSRGNLQHQLLEQSLSVNQSLIIKKGGNADSQYIYPLSGLQENQKPTQPSSPSKKQNSSLFHLKQKYILSQEDEILRSCKQYIAKLFKRREATSFKKKSPLKIVESPSALIEIQNIQTLLQQEREGTIGGGESIDKPKVVNEKGTEQQRNHDYERLYRYYDEKYIQNNKQDMSISSEIEFKSPNRSRLNSSIEKNKNQFQNSNDYYKNQYNNNGICSSNSSQKRVKSTQKRNSISSSQQKPETFTDLQPWNEQEKDQTSLSFFHKTIFNPQTNQQKQNKSISHENKHQKITKRYN